MKRHYRIPLLLCSLCTASLTAVAQNTTILPTPYMEVGRLVVFCATAVRIEVHRMQSRRGTR